MYKRQAIKKDVKIFMQKALKLEMSDTKTKVTHTGNRARFLGYDITVSVSYTHLDVYKRQSQFHSGKGFCKESRICQRLSDAGNEGHGGRRDCHG